MLVTLEDAFIAAYLVGVRHFSTADLRVTAARIMGIESDHRTLARVICADIPPQNGGPLATVTGLQGIPEPHFSAGPSNPLPVLESSLARQERGLNRAQGDSVSRFHGSKVYTPQVHLNES